MNNYEKLKKLYDQIDELLNNNITFSNEKFQAWYQECRRFLSNTYGADSVELGNFDFTRFQSMTFDKEESIRTCQNGLQVAKTNFKTLLDELSEEINSNNELNISDNKDKVFIVHGHDKGLKYQVSNLLRRIGLNPIILHEEENLGRTIIEKLEECSQNAYAAVILFTPDDIGRGQSEETASARGRQNVVFEAGFFIGLLGRKRTILIKSDKSVELPGDLDGMVYTEDMVEFKIAKELKAMGLPIDMNSL